VHSAFICSNVWVGYLVRPSLQPSRQPVFCKVSKEGVRVTSIRVSDPSDCVFPVAWSSLADGVVTHPGLMSGGLVTRHLWADVRPLLPVVYLAVR
jgi:hypothetical protein